MDGQRQKMGETGLVGISVSCVSVHVKGNSGSEQHITVITVKEDGNVVCVRKGCPRSLFIAQSLRVPPHLMSAIQTIVEIHITRKQPYVKRGGEIRVEHDMCEDVISMHTRFTNDEQINSRMNTIIEFCWCKEKREMNMNTFHTITKNWEDLVDHLVGGLHEMID